LTSVSAPFSMTKRFPLPARRNLASIDKTIESRSRPPPRAPRRSSLDSADFDPIGRDGYLLDNVPDKAFHLDGRRGEPSLRKLEGVARGGIFLGSSKKPRGLKLWTDSLHIIHRRRDVIVSVRDYDAPQLVPTQRHRTPCRRRLMLRWYRCKQLNPGLSLHFADYFYYEAPRLPLRKEAALSRGDLTDWEWRIFDSSRRGNHGRWDGSSGLYGDSDCHQFLADRRRKSCGDRRLCARRKGSESGSQGVRRTTATARYIRSIRRSIVMRSMQSVGRVRLDDGKHNISARRRPAPTPVRKVMRRFTLAGTPVRAIRLKSAAIWGMPL
jgi:hypothetical protein